MIFFFEEYGTLVFFNKSLSELESKNFESIKTLLDLNKQKFLIKKKKNIKILKKNEDIYENILHLINEKTLNPELVYNKLKEYLKSRGVEFIKKNCLKVIEEKKIIKTHNSNYKFDKIILACGSNFKKIVSKKTSAKILKQFYGAGISVDLKIDDPITFKSCIRSVNRGQACGVYLIPQKKKNIRIGATNKLWDKNDVSMDKNSLRELIFNFKKTFNIKKFKIVKVNYGFRPVSIDGFPIMGELTKDIFLIAGTRRDGWHCSPDISDYISTLVIKNKTKKNLFKEYNYFKPFRKPISYGKLEDNIRTIVLHEISAKLQHLKIKAKKHYIDKLKKQISIEVKKVLNYHGLKVGINPEIYPYLKYRAKIKKKINFYEV